MRGTTITLGLIAISLGAAAIATGYGAHLDLLGLTAGTVGIIGLVLLVLALLPERVHPKETTDEATVTLKDLAVVGQSPPTTP